MPVPALVVLISGLLGLALTVVNAITFQPPADLVPPAMERASVLAGAMAVGLLLVSVLWTRANPKAPERVELEGEQGLRLHQRLPEALQQELGWGSTMLLTATPAASLVLVWKGRELLRRGVLASAPFAVGPILERACSKQQLISMVNLKLYPGRDEFAYLPSNAPSVLVQPIGPDGWLVLAGWSVRCFSRSDELWIDGWCRKLRSSLEELTDAELGPDLPMASHP